MKRNIGFLALFLAISSLAFAFSTVYKPYTRMAINASVDSTADSIGNQATQRWVTASANVTLGECYDVRSIIGSIILDSLETSDGTPEVHGYGLEDSVVIRFGTRLKNQTGDVVLDSANAAALPCTLWVSHIANDTLFKGELFIEYVVWDSANSDTLEAISPKHYLDWHLIGRQ